MARFTDRAKWLPLLLAGGVFLWDFAALQWVFAHEPGITARVVFYFDVVLAGYASVLPNASNFI